MLQVTARDFMVSKLVTLRPDMEVLEAVSTLLKNRISGAPVVEKDGTFLGVFSEKCSMHAILDAFYEQLPSHQVRMFMDKDAKTVDPDTHLLTIAQVFLLTPYRRLPVLEDGKLIGQISRRDVLKVVLDLLKHSPAKETGSLLYLSALVERQEAPVS